MTKKYKDYLSAFKHKKYSFRMNSMNDSIECNKERMNDGLAAKIESELYDLGYHSAYQVRRNWTRLSYENKYHPILEYFDSLQWLGEPIFDQLCTCFDFNPFKTEIAEQLLWRFLLGVVGKVVNQEQNFMLVIDGKQGIGKSYFASWLCPLEKYFVEGGLNPDSNDTKLRVIGNLLWEVGELQYTTRKADIEALKNIISQRIMTVRPPYGRHDIEKPITASFIGTINETGAGFLNDPTGTRRFVVIKAGAIDWQYTKLNIDQLWAQVMTSYKMGERGKLSLDEQKEQIIINTGYDITSRLEEMFLKYYEIDLKKYADNWVPITDILDTLEVNGLSRVHQRIHQMELSSLLTKLGAKKSRANPDTGYGRLTCYQGIAEKQVGKSKKVPLVPF